MYDFAVVGSGVSGGNIAYELTAGGAQCVLLEAGKAFDATTFPGNEMGYSVGMYWGGGMELSRDARLAFLRGKCLGGTSVLNQALLQRFDRLAWDTWRARSGVGYFSDEAIEPLYQTILSRVTAAPVPSEFQTPNARAFARAFQQKGWDCQPILRANSDCRWDRGSDCMVCLGGCPRNSKQSTLVNGIPQARQAGLALETEFEVRQLIHHDDRVRILGRCRGQDREIEAAKACLAAGTFGNTQLLFQSPEIARRLPALGSAFCCHPQFMNYGLHREPMDFHKGPFSAVESQDPRVRAEGIKFENVATPPIATALLMPARGKRNHALLRKYRFLSCLEFAICDEPVGRLRMDRRGDLVREKRLTQQDRARIRRGRALALELLAAGGAHEVIACETGFGLHLMGGCPIGSHPDDSVVAPDFRVHGHPNLLVADSSIFPTAPGINPSFTIMALSLKASRAMLAAT